MATRIIHNEIAHIIVKNLPMKEIDEVNQEVDDKEMLKKYGRYHRQHWGHDPNPSAPDSIVINKGSGAREKARLVHIVVDTNPKVKKAVKRREMLKQIRKLK